MFSFISYEHLIIDSQVWELPHVYNPRSQDVQAGGSRAQGQHQPGLRETLSHSNKNSLTRICLKVEDYVPVLFKHFLQI